MDIYIYILPSGYLSDSIAGGYWLLFLLMLLVVAILIWIVVTIVLFMTIGIMMLTVYHDTYHMYNDAATMSAQRGWQHQR